MAPGSPTDGPREAADPAGHEPDVRLSFGNDATFRAWERTALGLITAGLAITQLLPSFDFPGGRRLIGLPLIALGTVIAAISYWEWRRNRGAIHEHRPLPRSMLPVVVAVVVTVVALFGFILVIVEGSGS